MTTLPLNEITMEDLQKLDLTVGDTVEIRRHTWTPYEKFQVTYVWSRSIWNDELNDFERDSDRHIREGAWQIDFSNGLNLRIGDPISYLYLIRKAK